MIKDIFSIKGKIFVITGGLGQLGKVYIDAILSNNGKVAVLVMLPGGSFANFRGAAEFAHG